MRRMPRISEKKSGFTLVELLVAMAVGSIVVALVMTTYWTQTMTKKNQELVMEMQQNIRSALFFMQQDLMMAGYGDDPSLSVDATITVAQPTAVRFTFADPLMKIISTTMMMVRPTKTMKKTALIITATDMKMKTASWKPSSFFCKGMRSTGAVWRRTMPTMNG